MENLKTVHCDGAIIVTTPQAVSIEDVRKEVTFCKKTDIPILGIIENMSGFVCTHCKECTKIFSSGGGAALAELVKVPLLGVLPIDPRVGALLGKACVKELPDSESAKVFQGIVNRITEKQENSN